MFSYSPNESEISPEIMNICLKTSRKDGVESNSNTMKYRFKNRKETSVNQRVACLSKYR